VVGDAVGIAANAVGSDTGTIATMAGAIGGAVTSQPPTVQIQDFDLIRSETTRLVLLAGRSGASSGSLPSPSVTMGTVVE
jgi:hypothetical protein